MRRLGFHQPTDQVRLAGVRAHGGGALQARPHPRRQPVQLAAAALLDDVKAAPGGQHEREAGDPGGAGDLVGLGV